MHPQTTLDAIFLKQLFVIKDTSKGLLQNNVRSQRKEISRNAIEEDGRTTLL